jgi:hypothetical protein
MNIWNQDFVFFYQFQIFIGHLLKKIRLFLQLVVPFLGLVKVILSNSNFFIGL